VGRISLKKDSMTIIGRRPLLLVVVFVGLASLALLLKQEAKKRESKKAAEAATNVNVSCDAGVRVIADGQFWGITQSRTNVICVKKTADNMHRMILQKPDYVPQVFTVTLCDWRKVQIVANSFIGLPPPPAQFVSPRDKFNRTDYGFGRLTVTSDPKDCTVGFRLETKPMPTDKDGAISFGDVCEGAYPIVFRHKDQILTTNITFRPHQRVSLHADFAGSCILDLIEMEARYRESIKDLIKKLKLNDYADFPALTEKQKNSIVWQLRYDKKWGQPNHKVICRDILEAQGYSFLNCILWTSSAIDLAEQQGWKDLTPLIAKIYERPKDVWVYERAFRYLRVQAGKPVSTNITANADILRRAGSWDSKVTDGQLLAAKESLSKEPDKEALLVYMLIEATMSGKGVTERGREAAIDVLKSLDRETVVQRVQQFRRDSREFGRDHIETAAKWLAVD